MWEGMSVIDSARKCFVNKVAHLTSTKSVHFNRDVWLEDSRLLGLNYQGYMKPCLSEMFLYV